MGLLGFDSWITKLVISVDIYRNENLLLAMTSLVKNILG